MSNVESAAPLREEERAAIFRGESGTVLSVDLGPNRIPRKVVVWIAVGFLVLGVGGVLLEHFFSNVNPVAANVVSTPPGPGPTPKIPTTPPIKGSLNAFVGLKSLGDVPAPSIRLYAQDGRLWTLGSAKGRVVVLTFYDARCDDICAVARDEMLLARTDLGVLSPHVEFIAVNTDPFHTATKSVGPAVGSVPSSVDYKFLDGRLRTLNTVWANYGVQVTVGAKRSELAHNNVMYVIDARGKLRDLLLPFANQDASGRYSLPTSEINRFARGVAGVVTPLIPR